jgi:protein phosphatase 1L|tara:strand:+ start:398 stop:1678 length:1281 start_codon:yes stop_codon:yes gene_type:complete
MRLRLRSLLSITRSNPFRCTANLRFSTTSSPDLRPCKLKKITPPPIPPQSSTETFHHLNQVAAALVAATATATALAVSTPCFAESGEEDKKQLFEPHSNFFQFGDRRNTPAKHKDRNYEPAIQKTCSTASVHASRGPRSYMEDEHYVSDEGNFFAVYDGHGGSGVAEHLSEHLWSVLIEMLNKQGHFIGTQGTFGGKDIQKAFLETCAALQQSIAKISKHDHVGSTATMVALDNSSIWSVNVGDSRSVLCRSGKAIDLSIDHKPNMPSELERITTLGGRVKWYGWEDEDGEPVASMGAWRINGNLSCSRSFGDRLEAPYVIAEPDIHKEPRNWMEDQFIILASDGLWDVFESQEAVDFVNNVWLGMNTQGQEEHIFNGSNERRSTDRRKIRASIQRRQAQMARYLVEEALRRGTMDNTTAVVVWLR